VKRYLAIKTLEGLKMKYDLVIENARVATIDKDNTILENCSIAIKDSKICDIFSEKEELESRNTIDAKGKLLTPGLIDCHTHLIYAGSRSDEFEMRLLGASYADVAKKGGGILSTVKATRDATVLELLESAKAKAKIMLENGITTLEIKSGYGLDLETELKMLKVAKILNKEIPTSIISTFLGAHAIPLEYKDDSDSYIDYIIAEMLPLIAEKQLAIFVDAFCENIAFSTEQVERLFIAAKKLGFKIKLHAEQLSDQKGAVMAAKLGASSVDHLEYLAENDCEKLANDKTVAVLLPGAFYFLKEKQLPPIAALKDNNVPIAISTDSNPGSSPFLSLPLMMNMACVFFRLTIAEVFRGVTINAAKALDIDKEVGSIEVGKKADLVLWSTDNLNDIIYNPNINYCDKIIKNGSVLNIC
jgi:imidazolonepropionase